MDPHLGVAAAGAGYSAGGGAVAASSVSPQHAPCTPAGADAAGSGPIPGKLGACYNVFDGHELLEYSIKAIRSEVAFVCVVYQKSACCAGSCCSCCWALVVTEAVCTLCPQSPTLGNAGTRLLRHC